MTRPREIAAATQMRDRIAAFLFAEGRKREGVAAGRKGKLLLAMAHEVGRMEPLPAKGLPVDEDMPATATAAWDAYSASAIALAAAEGDLSTTASDRSRLALEAHRAWSAWCQVMNLAGRQPPRLASIQGGKAA